MLLAASLCLALAGPSATTNAPPGLQRIALMGASVTDGFLLPLDVDAMVTLADVVAAACKDPVPPPLRKSSSFFFADPQLHGRLYAKAVKDSDPTLVVAIDFLFWFAYGDGYPEDFRERLFEQGLDLLDGIHCPLLVGDLPDMSPAIHGVGIIGGPMIHAGHLPAPATRAKLNARLREWASARKNVHVVPLDEFVTRMRSGQPFELHGNRYDAAACAAMMDTDLLHPRFEGTIALAILIVDTLVKADPAFPESAFVFDAKTIRERVLAARAVEIAQRTRGRAVKRGS